MAADFSGAKKPNSVIMENRKALTVSGVNDVDSFDSTGITAYTDYGQLTVRGSDLKMSRLSTESGELNIEGEISSLSYNDDLKGSQGFFSRLFR